MAFDFGGLFGAVGSIAGAAIGGAAMKDATQMQIDALNKQRDFVYGELDPSKLSGAATAADVQQTKDQLALQAITDPSLLKARYAGSASLADQIAGIGQGGADKIAALATSEAMAGGGKLDELKNQLIDAALQEIQLGASLPPDVQAELTKAGLETAGTISGAATARGIGGQPLRKLYGQEALKLQAERQSRALALGQAASSLEANRAALLSNLFPNLSALQGANAGLAGAGVATSAANMPSVGLSGNDVANIWLARVGATNQLAQSQADIGAQSGLAQAQLWNNAIGSASTQAGKVFQSII